MLRLMRGVLRKTKKLKRFLPVSDRQWAKFDLLRTLVRRDLEARYKGSVLGNIWPLVNQISQLLIYTYVFAIVLKVKLSLHGYQTITLPLVCGYLQDCYLGLHLRVD